MEKMFEIKVRFPESEYVKLNENVKKSGLSREAYLRSVALEKQPKALPPMALFDVLKELRQINAGMIQIAMKAHALQYIDAPFYSQCHNNLQASVGKIMRAVYG